MTTPARKYDPNAVIPDEVYAAEKIVAPVNALRAAVEGSPDETKDGQVLDLIMRSSGMLLKGVLRLLAIPRTAPPRQDAGDGPPGGTNARDDPTAA